MIKQQILPISLIAMMAVIMPVKADTVFENSALPASSTAAVNPMVGTQPVSQLVDNIKNRLHLDGFASVGVAASDVSANQNYPIAEHGNVAYNYRFNALTLLGLQLSADLATNTTGVIQLVSNGDDTQGHIPYSVNTPLAVLKYQATDNLDASLGRMRVPLFLHSDTLQVGFSYPSLFLPNEVYTLAPFDNLNGVDSGYTMPLGNSAWSLKVESYFGNNSDKYDMICMNTTANNPCLYTESVAIVDSGSEQNIPVNFYYGVDFYEDNILGGKVSLSSGAVTLMAAFSEFDLSYIKVNPDDFQRMKYVLGNSSIYNFAEDVRLGDFQFTSEYGHRDLPNPFTSQTAYYASMGYHWNNWFPTINYANLKTTDSFNKGQDPQAQESYTGSIVYYINPQIDIKGSISEILPLDGTWGLFDKDPASESIYMYGISLDAIF